MSIIANAKDVLCFVVGVVGGAIASLFGGWNAALSLLVILMVADYATGLLVAGVFKKSSKTQNGALESKAGFKGLCRKCMVLIFVLIAYQIDLVLGTTYLRDAVCIGFCLNEIISLTENAGLMGVPLPSALEKAIEMLREKAE